MKYINIIFFIAAALLSASVLLFVKNTNRSIGTSVSNRNEIIILAVTLAISIGIRIWQFGIVPEGFNQDGAMAAVDGNALATYGTDRFGTYMPAHLYGWGVGQMSCLLSYLMVPFIKLMGLNSVSARLPQLLASIMGGIFFWLFTRDCFGKKAGIIAAIFVSINPWHFLQSRWALDCNLLPHFFIGGIFLLNRGSSGNKTALYLSMLFFGLCMYCYGITIYTIPLFLVLACILLLKKKLVHVIDAIVCVIIYLLISWPFILTMMINTFGWETIELPFVTCPFFPDSIRSHDILVFSEHPFTQLKKNFLSLLNVVILQKKDLAWNDVLGYGTMYLFSMPFALCGVVSTLQHRKETGAQLLLLMFLTGIWVGLMTNDVNINRVNLIFYSVMLFIVLGIDYISCRLKFTLLPIGLAYALCAVALCMTYFGAYREGLSSVFCSGFGEALQAAEDTGTDIIYVTADTFETGSTNVSEILTLFYDATDAEYFQGKTDINKGEEELPYNERFIYVSFTEDNLPEEFSAVCVIRQEDKNLFEDDYEITDYNNYALAIKR